MKTLDEMLIGKLKVDRSDLLADLQYACHQRDLYEGQRDRLLGVLKVVANDEHSLSLVAIQAIARYTLIDIEEQNEPRR